MLLSKTAKVKITMKNIEYYRNRGYTVETYIDKDKHVRVKNNTYIDVDIKDLSPSSYVKVDVLCDYCNKKFQKSYVLYNDGHIHINKDCCSSRKCINQKTKEVKIYKYGTNSTKEIASMIGFQLGRNKKYSVQDVLNICAEKGYDWNGKYTFPSSVIVKDHWHLTCQKHNYSFSSPVETLVDKNVHNCPKCASDHVSKTQSQSTIEEAEKICQEKNYTLLTTYIRNCDDAIEFICNMHPDYGIQTTTLYCLKRSKNSCSVCKRPRGESHYNWQGGLSSERDSVMASYKYKKWRENVFKRDNYTCQCCGTRGVKLHAHHLYNFADYDKLRLDVDNGITLCEKCHSPNIKGSFHSVYGTYHNTPEQFYEYCSNHDTGR